MSTWRSSLRGRPALALATLVAIAVGGWALEPVIGWAPSPVSAAGPATPDARDALQSGWRHLRGQAPAQAASAFRDALAQRPAWTEALQGLARAEAARGRHAEAVLALSLALASGTLDAGTEQSARGARFAWQQRLLLNEGGGGGAFQGAAGSNLARR